MTAQYFLTGEVMDGHGDKLQNVLISSHSTGAVYQTDLVGEFRILSRTMDDTLTFAVDGYESYTTAIHTTGYLLVTLRMNSFDADENERRLVSRIMVAKWGGRAPGGPGGGVKDSAVAGSKGGGVKDSAVAGSKGGGPGLMVSAKMSFVGAGYSGRVENPFVPQAAMVSFTGAVGREFL